MLGREGGRVLRRAREINDILELQETQGVHDAFLGEVLHHLLLFLLMLVNASSVVGALPTRNTSFAAGWSLALSSSLTRSFVLVTVGYVKEAGGLEASRASVCTCVDTLDEWSSCSRNCAQTPCRCRT